MPRRSCSPLEERSNNHRRNHRNNNRNHNNRSRKSPDCRLCKKDHPLRKCLKFKKMNVVERLNVIKRFRYCENCLAHSHLIRRCHNTDRCRTCGGKHHSLLHRHARLRECVNQTSTSTNQLATSSTRLTLLPTIIVKIQLGDDWGNVRGLLNACAPYSSVAEFLVTRYKLLVETIGEVQWCKLKIKSRVGDGVTLNVKAKVATDLPTKQPTESIDERVAERYANLRLADPNFFTKSDINIILGADVYPRLIKSGIQPEEVGSPMAQDTLLGWVLIGSFGL